jgi:hypothetical protein
MGRVETSIEIARPQEAVFAYLTDLHNAKDWATELVDVTYDGELAEGTTGVDTRKLGRKEILMPWEVTTFDPPNRVVFEYGPPFPATAQFVFQPAGRGTRLTCATDLRPRGFWRLVAPVMVWEARKTDQVQFEKVKGILESRAANGSATRRGA